MSRARIWRIKVIAVLRSRDSRVGGVEGGRLEVGNLGWRVESMISGGGGRVGF